MIMILTSTISTWTEKTYVSVNIVLVNELSFPKLFFDTSQYQKYIEKFPKFWNIYA